MSINQRTSSRKTINTLGNRPNRIYTSLNNDSMVDSELDELYHRTDQNFSRQRSLKTEFELVDNATRKSLIRENQRLKEYYIRNEA